MRLLSLLLFLAISHSSFGQVDTTASQRIAEEIAALNRAMEMEFNKGNYSKIGTFYADSAVMVGNKVEVIGQDQLIRYWGQFENAHQWELENIELRVLGERAALQRGYSNITYYNRDQLMTSRSIFSLVWIKTAEGWKILLDHFSPR